MSRPPQALPPSAGDAPTEASTQAPSAPPVSLPVDRPIVVALSGGPDSSTLLSLVAERATAAVRAVHVHHHLRPSAHHDAALAAALCRDLDVPLRVVHLDGAALRHAPRGVSAAARAARYRALAREADALGPSAVVVTGHTANDRLETMWIRMAQGCGFGALDGPRRETRIAGADVLRPLLGWWRSDVEAYIDCMGLVVARDPSNADRQRLRAVVRHDVLPALTAAIGSRAPLERTLEQLQLDVALLRRLVDDRLDAVSLDGDDTTARLDRSALQTADATIVDALVHRALHRVGARPDAAFVARVRAAIRTPGARHLDGPGVAVDIEGGAVRLTRVVSSARAPSGAGTSARAVPPSPGVHHDRPTTAKSPGDRRLHIVLAPPRPGGRTTTRVPGGYVDRIDGPPPPSPRDAGPATEWFDADALDEPLAVVSADPDAGFVPFGATRERTVDAILRSDGVAAAERRTMLAVRAGPHILTLLGLRRSAIAPITASTTRAIGIRWRPDASLPPAAASLG